MSAREVPTRCGRLRAGCAPCRFAMSAAEAYQEGEEPALDGEGELSNHAALVLAMNIRPIHMRTDRNPKGAEWALTGAYIHLALAAAFNAPPAWSQF